MKSKYRWAALAAMALLLLGSLSRPPAIAQGPAASRLNLWSTSDRAIVLELAVPDFQIETVAIAGQTYHRLRIPGLAQTGQTGRPQLPTRGALVGLPSPEGLSVAILEADGEMLPGRYRLYPAPKPEPAADALTGSTAEAVPTTDAFQPGRLVQIGQTGYIRDQAVAQVQFYPAQYNPATGQVRLYRRIVARLTWTASPSGSTVERRGASPAYEKLLQDTLLNYEALNRPVFPGGGTSPEDLAIGPAAVGDSAPALKIGVVEDGLVELTYNDLAGAGLDPAGVDPRTIKIRVRGAEIPVYAPGQDDGVFDPADTLLFYGQAITGIYTVENVYWLTAGGDPGRRMAVRDGSPSGAPVPAHFPATLHAEENSAYWQTMPNGQGQDHWFWGDKLTAPASREYSLSLNNISTTASTATVRLRLKGRTAVQSLDPDHHTKLYLNNVDVEPGGQWWDGQTIFDQELTVPHSTLSEGENLVRLELVGDTGATVDQVYHNWIEIDYWDTYVAENDELRFGAPGAGTFQFEVTGFSSNDVEVFDVTDPANVVILTQTAVVTNGQTYKLTFQDTAQPETRYLALTPARRKSPASLEPDQPSSWKSAANGADYILITHEDFYTSTLRLAEHRAASGLRTVTVKVEDLYDEFNDGIFHPQAIRDFLSYAYNNWIEPAPTYVVLVGDAYQDYRDYLNTGTVNYVPTQIIETDILGETPSDNWFVLVSGEDLLPDMLVGRLSAQTRAQVDHIVAKIIDYEQNPGDGVWNRRALVVADDGSSAFEITSEQIIALLPDDYTATRVYAADYPPGNPTNDIAGNIDNGVLLLNYTGHGSVDSWGTWQEGSIFSGPDIDLLNNPGRLPVVTVANCLNGFFSGPQTQVSIAERFLRLQDKGAVAVWAPTGLSYPSGHQALMTAFYEAIFQDGQSNLGAATNAAKLAVSGQNNVWDELIETYVLFGDPAMSLGVPDSTPGGGTGSIYLPLAVKN
ncbi:MAG: C25 family cysteine peptidase [Anaerolineae bacterium]